MSVFEARAELWRWMAGSWWFRRIVVPLLLLCVLALFMRADLKNRECIQSCKSQGHPHGFHVGGRNSGDRCVCVDQQGRNVNVKKQNSNQEQ